jgi:UDP-N-acetylglucosamine acyltransferase
MSTTIDPRAQVSPKARLGVNVSIGPFAIVEDDVVIGDGTIVGPSAFIGNGARIGKDCRIHHGATVSHAPQDLKYNNEPTTCHLGDRNVVREYATIHRGTVDSGRTVIGNDNFLMAYTHIAHDCELGNHIILSNAAMMAGHCIIEDFVIVGGITPIHQFVRIGCHAMIGGGLRVPKDVPPYTLAGGNPLVCEGLNSIGLRRRGFPPATIAALDRVYTLVYHSKLNVSAGIAKVREDSTLLAIPEVRHVVDFITASKRGIIGAPRLQGDRKS